MKFAHLYIHVPFCRSKCNYCDFVSYPVGESGQELAEYSGLLCRELELWREAAALGPWRSVYWGGGTPSLLPTEAVGEVMAALRAQGLAAEAEVTLEANPESLTAEKLAAWRAAGVNRLSLGVQSFDDALLSAMGRPHTAAQARAAVRLAQEAGFANLSLDLIYGLPGQTLAGWQADLQAALALGPSHISLYGLGLSEDSPWGREVQAGRMTEVDQDHSADLLEEAMRVLPAAGYGHYEISNFAQAGYESRHNCAYWLRDNYLGIGAAAASCAAMERWSNERDLTAYRGRLEAAERPQIELERLSIEEVLGEALFLGLRLLRGVDLAAYQARYGVDPAQYYKRPLQKLERQGLVETVDGQLRLTQRGLMLGNEVFMQFSS